MRRIVFALALLAAGLSLPAGEGFAGDTGTYRILSYRVALTPHSDGTVAIEYYQKWLVTGGHIPWITVGTPNSSFTITGSGGAAVEASSAGGGGWSGVRLDLDADYREGQTFEASFSIVQSGLFYAEQETYRLDFTPGWYDRAETDTLRVSVRFYASIETVSASPEPSSVSGDEMAWMAYRLGPGERFTIHASFPAGLFPGGIDKSNLKGASGAGAPKAFAIIVFVIIVIVFILILISISRHRGGYSGGGIFYGGMPGGRIGGGRSGGGRSSGGGGGFGGASMSCACACVSCACACACAGGGGAGCGRKLEHSCPLCGKRHA